MRHLSKIAMVLTFGLATAGCFVPTDPGPYDGPHGGGGGPVVTPTPSPALDAPVSLGLRGMPGYHVAAGASAALPDGDLGFIVTANGQGGYRVTWSDTYGSAAHFSGTITTDGYFDANQVVGYSGAEYITVSHDARQITFESTPGNYVDGVDLVSSTDPIYLDLIVDGYRSGFGVYFTGAQTGALINSAYVPVAFTSP
jgi:hypothetical protein